MIQIRAIFYDFDGPISDSFDSGLNSLLRLCKKRGIKITEEQRVKLIELWGISGIAIVKKALALTDGQAANLYSAWVGMEKESPHNISTGAAKALSHAHAAGMVNILFTSRDMSYITKELRRMKLSNLFDLKFTSDNLEALKPNPKAFFGPLALLMREFNIRREECLFIGDTWADAACGAGARVNTLIVLNGPYRYSWHARKCFVGKGNLLGSIKELPNWLSRQNPRMIET